MMPAHAPGPVPRTAAPQPRLRTALRRAARQLRRRLVRDGRPARARAGADRIGRSRVVRPGPAGGSLLCRLAHRGRPGRSPRPAPADGRRRRGTRHRRPPLSPFRLALVATAGVSALSAFFEPTSSAALPNLVDDEDLPTANVLLGSAWGTMLAVGAALGGLVAATLGRDAAFALDAASFAVSALLIIGIRRSFGGAVAGSTVDRDSGGFRESLRETWALARGSRRISALLLAKTTFGVGTGAIFLLAVFGSRVFGAGDVGIGILFAARGLGALIAPFLARAMVGLDDRGLIVGIGASFVGFVCAYLLLPLAPTIAVAAVLVFLGHLGGGAQWMLSSLGLQRAVPDAIRGRVFSADYALVTLAVAVSTLVAGAVASAAGPAFAPHPPM